jgi:23S rRNA pseudoU1915 N3-methylase RlmH
MSVAELAAMAEAGLSSRQNKRKKIDAESGYISSSPSKISTFFEPSDLQVTLEDAIMKFLADCDIAPNVLDKRTFAEVIRAAHELGQKRLSFVIPNRKECGLDGAILERVAQKATTARETWTRGVESDGNTLCSDGAKTCKRSALNSVLVTSGGIHFVQSTDSSSFFAVN